MLFPLRPGRSLGCSLGSHVDHPVETKPPIERDYDACGALAFNYL